MCRGARSVRQAQLATVARAARSLIPISLGSFLCYDDGTSGRMYSRVCERCVGRSSPPWSHFYDLVTIVLVSTLGKEATLAHTAYAKPFGLQTSTTQSACRQTRGARAAVALPEYQEKATVTVHGNHAAKWLPFLRSRPLFDDVTDSTALLRQFDLANTATNDINPPTRTHISDLFTEDCSNFSPGDVVS